MSTPAWVFEYVSQITQFANNFRSWLVISDVREADDPGAKLLGQYTAARDGYLPQGDITVEQAVGTLGTANEKSIVRVTIGFNAGSDLSWRVRTATADDTIIDDVILSAGNSTQSVGAERAANALMTRTLKGLTPSVAQGVMTQIDAMTWDVEFSAIDGNEANVTKVAVTNINLTLGEDAPSDIGPI